MNFWTLTGPLWVMLPFYLPGSSASQNMNVTNNLPKNLFISVNSSNVFSNISRPTVNMSLPTLSDWLDFGPLV
jgi:hypothetical protein